ncbi:MAG: penicillin-binding protein [Bacilli bacterium]|nr:penicillin-binding protein [Bacilli bacterium]
MKKRKKNNIRYSKLVILSALFLFGLIIFRVSYLALSEEIDGKDLKKLAASRTSKTDITYAIRGNIYSRNGDLLAQNVTSYKLIAYLDPKRTTNKKKPQHVIDKEKTATLIGPIIGYSKDEMLKYLNKTNVYQTEFGIKGKNLNEVTKNKIADLNLPGIDFIESYRRYYPKGDFASYTIGYAKTNEEGKGDDTTGEMGIEKYYDKTLKGTNGSITYQKDLRGYRIANTPVIVKEATAGKDIYLTIDSNIEFFVEQAINKADKDYDFEWFHMTVMDAKTGAILATSTHPSFDPNKKNITNYMDLLVSSAYEPGSTMKTFTYMAAMENGVYNGNETYESGVYRTTDGTEIGDWNRNGWGTLTFDKGYAMSSNVGVINIIHRHLSAVNLRQYFRKLGFGHKTGISLPNEESGKLDFKYETEIFNAGFGQGITTTPIQNAKALTPLTNDGMLLQPYIVEKIVDPETKEVTLKNSRHEIERVASTTTVNKMKQLMNDCVNGIGNTGSGYRLDNGELIGKTGTAQIADTRTGGYIEGTWAVISSFAGIYPKSNPKVIIYASINKPTAGSQTPISNAVKDLTANLSKYYGKSETTTVAVKEYELPNFTNKSLEKTKTTLNTNGIKYTIIGGGNKVIKQIPSSKIKVTNNDMIYLITNDSNIKMPNVVGVSSKTAKNLLEELGLKVTLNGVGYVTKQSIPVNAKLIQGQEVKLDLSPKFKE